MDEREVRTRLRLRAGLHRRQAAELELAAVAIETARSLNGFSAACAAAIAPYEAERATAHFEGRVPPSLEVFATEEAH